jgi:hypothetical protein
MSPMLVLVHVSAWTVETVQRSQNSCGQSDRRSQRAREVYLWCEQKPNTQMILSAPTHSYHVSRGATN